MKQGSTDDPFAEDPEQTQQTQQPPADESAQDDSIPETESNDLPDDETVEDKTASSSENGVAESDTASARVLPYIYRRDSVKEQRTQRPVYLRDYNEERLTDLVDTVEAELGEDVTKTDVLEAAIETAIENPEQVAEILRTERYGYDWA